VLEFFRDPWIPRLTQEFQSPDFLRDHRVFLLALVGSILILALRPRPHWTHFMVICGTAGMALIMNRNIVQFGFLAVPLLTLSISQVLSSPLRRLAPLRRFEENSRTGVSAPYFTGGLLVLVALAVSRGQVGSIQVVEDGFDRNSFPVRAVAWARANKAGGRLFHEFEWGGYLLYAWPEQPIFIDGGTDFFSGAFMRAQGTVLTLQPGWRDSLAAWRIDHALLATGSSLAAELLRSPSWHPLYCDPTAVFLRLDDVNRTGSINRRDCQPGSGLAGER
jgi:hypothetical protein